MAPEKPSQCLLKELVERYLQGDVKACEQLLIDPTHRLRVERIARRYIGDTSVTWEDAAQEAHEKLLECTRSQKFRQGGVKEFYSWAAAIAQNAIIDIVRKEKRRRGEWFRESLDQQIPGTDVTLGETIADDFDLWDAVERANLVLKVREAVEKIDQLYPKKGYYKLWMGLVQEKDLCQIAAELGVKQPEISKRRKELLQRIAGKLELLTVEQVKREVEEIRHGQGIRRDRSAIPWEDNSAQREAVKAIDRQYPEKNYLKLWEGLIQGKTQKELKTELSISQSEVSKRQKKLSEFIAGRDRSDTQW